MHPAPMHELAIAYAITFIANSFPFQIHEATSDGVRASRDHPIAGALPRTDRLSHGSLLKCAADPGEETAGGVIAPVWKRLGAVGDAVLELVLDRVASKTCYCPLLLPPATKPVNSC